MYFIMHESVANNINVMQHLPYYTNLNPSRHLWIEFGKKFSKCGCRI